MAGFAWVFIIFWTFILTGTSNAVNITDGLDGLATGLSAIAFGTFAIFSYIIGRVDYSRYLGIFYLQDSGELTVFCLAMVGALIGFLWYNTHPAQVFMGDTGALALGGALGRRRDPAQVGVRAGVRRRGVRRRDDVGDPSALRVQVPAEALRGSSTRRSTASFAERRCTITSRRWGGRRRRSSCASGSSEFCARSLR